MRNQGFRRIFTFSRRVFLELVRDPLSYIFALGLPLVMLGIMTLVNRSIPAEAAMELFTPASLTPGIAVFGETFLMLFTAILLADDRSGQFLVRLTVSPMRSGEFLLGYTIPILLLSILQGIITYAAGFILSAMQGETFDAAGMLAAMAVSVPTAVFFIALGFLLGCLFGNKAAPGVSSMIISAAALLGGIWMDIDMMGGVWLDICRVLPFYHAVRAARLALCCEFDGIITHIAVVGIYVAVLCVMASLVFMKKRKK